MKLGPLQTAWLAALRSGEYLQTPRYLFDPTTHAYCCLGVACLVAGLKPDVINDQGVVFAQFEDQQAILPDSVAEKMRFHNTGGESSEDPERRLGLRVALYQLNDNRQLSFEQIADIVEANPDHYFSEPA